MSEGGRRLKTNSPIRQNHVLVIRGGSRSCSELMAGGGALMNSSHVTPHRILPTCFHVAFSHFLLGVKAFEHPATLTLWCTYIWNSNSLRG